MEIILPTTEDLDQLFANFAVHHSIKVLILPPTDQANQEVWSLISNAVGVNQLVTLTLPGNRLQQ